MTDARESDNIEDLDVPADEMENVKGGEKPKTPPKPKEPQEPYYKVTLSDVIISS